MTREPDVSIVLPTYNRAAGLRRAVESALLQTAAPDSYELIVVDNNSPDETRAVVEGLAQEYSREIRYVLERQQGVSYARNAGIAAATAPIVAFFDDDVCVAPNWVETIRQAFAESRALECLGGRVLPDWVAPPPSWLTPEHWAPLALQDFGDEPIAISSADARGLISANLACRTAVFERVGGFSPTFQRVKDGIGSLEDDEWMRRFWKAGGRAMYLPELVAYTAVPSDRLTRAYHRRWHSGHGQFYARLHAEEMERSSRGTFFGVPAHLYRSLATGAVAWIVAASRGHRDQAFAHEVKLRFIRGFLRQRFTERLFS
jgi:glucosyl-dolichyl phosphate glucuronosyltransferase